MKQTNVQRGDFNLMESAVSAPELNQIAENTYFLPYVSTNPKFPYRMAQACIKDAEFTGLPLKLFYTRQSIFKKRVLFNCRNSQYKFEE